MRDERDGETDGKLNLRSVLLEGCIKYSMGRRVKLNLENVTNASLFPGQIVAVHGVNPSGYCFIAQKIVDTALPAMPSTPIVEADGDIDMVRLQWVAVFLSNPYSDPRYCSCRLLQLDPSQLRRISRMKR